MPSYTVIGRASYCCRSHDGNPDLPTCLACSPNLTQIVGAGLRVSCATRILAPCLGAVGVGAASALSGHVSRHVKRQADSGRSVIDALVVTPFWVEPLDLGEAVMDAVAGLTIFKVRRGGTTRGEGHLISPCEALSTCEALQSQIMAQGCVLHTIIRRLCTAARWVQLISPLGLHRCMAATSAASCPVT